MASKPTLFTPSKVRQLTSAGNVVYKKNSSDVSDTNIGNSGSFRYDTPGTGLKSTQQLGVDFSKFEHHTFFNSAVANVNVAFDKIVTEFPFDGTRQELESFFDGLTGFEKYVYDSFPKNTGYLNFSGSNGTGGTYIRVNDSAGATVAGISKNKTGTTILDPGLSSFSIEMHLLPASSSNDNQVITQKITGSSGEFGFTLALSASASPNSCSVIFSVSSGSQQLSTSATVLKGQFTHLCAVMNRKPGLNRAQLFINEQLSSTSIGYSEFGDFGFTNAPMLIGSGTTCKTTGVINQFIPQQTFSGSIDEFRFFHAPRSQESQKFFGKKTIYASPELKLLFKFNEPTGSIGSDSIVLDSSGNSLHALISGFQYNLRTTGSIDSPMTYESRTESPVLFPGYSKFINLNSRLLTSASLYDDENPNLITRLVPEHYFNMGAHLQGFNDAAGDISDSYSGGGLPRTGRLGSTQILTAFLYVYAKYFDELKMMIDAFSDVISVDYDPETSTPDQFLTLAAKFRGVELPNIFGNSSIEQHIFGDNTSLNVSIGEPLSNVQNQIWRRILTNLNEIIRSKGTLHSIKSIIRAIGINPDSTMRLREFGGSTRRSLATSRENRTEVSAMIDMSGSIFSIPVAVDAQGWSSTIPHFTSNFMSASRLEIGYPNPQGTMSTPTPSMIHGMSDSPADGLFTSGSWTYEAIYKFPTLLTGTHAASQSLARMHVTSTLSPSHGVIANLVLFSSESNGEEADMLRLYCRPGAGKNDLLLQMQLTGVNIFDGNKWNISFGRTRGDSIGSISSSYFLRAARQNFGVIHELYTTSSFFSESEVLSDNSLQNIDSAINTSGAFIAIGSQSLETTNYGYLNTGSSVVSQDARLTSFTGRVGQIRFWSKDLRIDEWTEHVRNFKSLGVIDPKINFNFAYQPTGSFERLRLDCSFDQYATSSDSNGQLVIQDFSQNGMGGIASGFVASQTSITPETFYFSTISPKFDEASTSDKIRVRSYTNPDIDSAFSGSISPVYEIDQAEIPNDDTRFAIDISSVAALDEDIMNIFATLRELDNAIGAPELQFSPDYPQLESLRNVYFRRLTGKINLKSFFEFFKWFDTSMGMFIEGLLPRKTKFMGINYVIESHMLERAKFEHYSSDAYLGESNRMTSRAAILLQQIVGTVTRY